MRKSSNKAIAKKELNAEESKRIVRSQSDAGSPGAASWYARIRKFTICKSGQFLIAAGTVC